MNKFQIILLSFVFCFIFEQIDKTALGEDFSKNLHKYHFCHRCGMAIEKGDTVITVSGVKKEPWYQCCPMCALMDIIETGNGNGVITAYGNKIGQKIEIIIENHKIRQIKPESTILLVGGSCPKNKIFFSRDNTMEFMKKTSWAKKKMLKPVSKVFVNLKDKKKAKIRCSMCTTPLKEHERTWFTIMTKNKRREVQCCAHCGLFSMYKLKDKVIRATTPDFVTGRLIDAKKAYYVVGNDLLLCCFPSTISFENPKDAEEFQIKHDGEILTFQETMLNIKKVMKR